MSFLAIFHNIYSKQSALSLRNVREANSYAGRLYGFPRPASTEYKASGFPTAFHSVCPFHRISGPHRTFARDHTQINAEQDKAGIEDTSLHRLCVCGGQLLGLVRSGVFTLTLCPMYFTPYTFTLCTYRLYVLYHFA